MTHEENKKHRCPECGNTFTAAVVVTGDTEELELTWTRTEPGETDEQRTARLCEEWNAERNAAGAIAAKDIAGESGRETRAGLFIF